MKKIEDFLVTGLLNEADSFAPYSQQGKALEARKRAEEKLASGEPLDPNDLFYFQYIGKDSDKPESFTSSRTGESFSGLATKGEKLTPEDINVYHGYGSTDKPAKQSYELPSATTTDPSSDLPPSDKRISPAYWVTHKDFQTATGEKYDPRSARHRQLFFDLNAKGESTVSPLAGPGEGPAYDSLEYHTMRRRPKEIPQFGTPGSFYDRIDGQLAATTPQSRASAAEVVAKKAAEDRIDREEKASWKKAQEKANENIGKELALDYINKFADKLKKPFEAKQKEMSDTRGGADFDVQRGQFPIDMYTDMEKITGIQRPDREFEPTGLRAVDNAANLGLSALKNSAIELGSELARKAKEMTMQAYPTTERIAAWGSPQDPRGGADFDVQRGQFPIDMYTDMEKITGIQDPSIKDRIGTEEEPMQAPLGAPKPPFIWKEYQKLADKKYSKKSDRPDEDLTPYISGEKYAVPGSQIWSRLSQEDRIAMAQRALKRKEPHKFYGGDISSGKFAEDRPDMATMPEGWGQKKGERLTIAKYLNQLLAQGSGQMETSKSGQAPAGDGYQSFGPPAPSGEESKSPVVNAAVQDSGRMGIKTKIPTGFNFTSPAPLVAQEYLNKYMKKFSKKGEAPVLKTPQESEFVSELDFVPPRVQQSYDPEHGATEPIDPLDFEAMQIRALARAAAQSYVDRTPHYKGASEQEYEDLVNMWAERIEKEMNKKREYKTPKSYD